MTWACKCIIFAEDYVGLEGNNPSQFKPYWRPHHHGGGYMRSSTRGLLEVDVVGCCVDETLFSSALLITVVYEMMILLSEHAHKRHVRGG